jgi:hypothetical protein
MWHACGEESGIQGFWKEVEKIALWMLGKQDNDIWI